MVTAGDFRNGVTFEMEGKVYQIVEFQHVKPGKGAAFVRTKIRNVIEGSVFDVVRKNSIQTASSGSGVTYKDSDILGTFTVTTSGEEISEGLLEYRGFYDRVNTGDELVLISRPKTDEENAAQIVSGSQNNANANANIAPQGNANGESVVEQKSPGLTAEDLGVRRTPAFIDLVRSIY